MTKQWKYRASALRRIAILTLITPLVFGASMAFSQTPTIPPIPANATLEDLDRLKKQYTALTEAYAARELAIKGQQSLDKATAPTDPNTKMNEEKTAALALAKATAETQKQIADAKKSALDLENQTLAAKYAFNTTSTNTGVTTADREKGAGKQESILLSVRAMNSVADLAVLKFPENYRTKKTDVILTTSENLMLFQKLLAFKSEEDLLNAAYKFQLDSDKKLNFSEPQSIVGAGLALDAVSKFLGFFKSEYTVTGIDIESDDNMLMTAFAGAVKKKFLPGSRVFIPSMYYPQTVSDDFKATKLLSSIASIRSKANQRVSIFSIIEKDKMVEIGTLTKKAEDPTASATVKSDTNIKIKQLTRERDEFIIAIDAWKAVIQRIDSWISMLGTPGTDGVSPIVLVINQNALYNQLTTAGEANIVLVAVKLNFMTSAQYTKKNWLSSLGAMPFFISGGAVASFTALDGKDGSVVIAGVIPVHGGYMSVSDAAAIVNGDPDGAKSAGGSHGK